VEFHRRGASLAVQLGLGCREMRELAPVLGLHLPVELRQRVEDDLIEHRLDGRVILRRVIHENARGAKRRQTPKSGPARMCVMRGSLTLEKPLPLKLTLSPTISCNRCAKPSQASL
jgi:hypothetical protein